MTKLQEALMGEKLRKLNGQARFDGWFKRYVKTNARELYFKAMVYAKEKARPRFKKPSPDTLATIKEGKRIL